LTPLPLRILGAGVHRPSRVVRSEEMDRRLGKPAGWSAASTGVEVRRFADPERGETASAMAAAAAREALAAAGLEPQRLSAVVGACGVMEQPIPGASVLVHRRLGLEGSGVPALDLNATCLSVLPALQWAALHLQAGLAETILVFAADLASAALPDDDDAVTPLFGDGAAALVVGRPAPGEASALLACRLETYSEGADAAWLGAGGSRLPARDLPALLAEASFRMDGPTAYRVAARRLPALMERVLAEAGATLADIDWIVPHQASGQALELMRRRLRLPIERMVVILRDHGNQVAASMPTALALALQDGRVRAGQHLLLIGAGAGVSVGAAVLRT
jgi:3-oxoacyl-[acyl-carrier-protein] synthase III